MAKTDDLHELWEKIVRRDESAFARFYDLSAPAAYGLAMRITEDGSLAQDVLAEAYVQVWQKAARYEQARGSVMSWLLVVVRSRAIDLVRKRRLVTRTEGLSRNEQWGYDSEDDPLDIMERIEKRSIIYEALSSLPNHQRQIIALAFFRGLTHSEIATHTGMPLGTVKSMLRSSMYKLRKTLGTEQQINS